MSHAVRKSKKNCACKKFFSRLPDDRANARQSRKIHFPARAWRKSRRKGEKVKMMDEKEIMPYNFFKYGGVYTGEHHGMRYLIKNTGEKPDFKLMVQVWLGPYASTVVPDEKKTTQYFESSVKGRKEAINWLHEQYETRRGEWDTAPALLDAVLPQ